DGTMASPLPLSGIELASARYRSKNSPQSWVTRVTPSTGPISRATWHCGLRSTTSNRRKRARPRSAARSSCPCYTVRCQPPPTITISRKAALLDQSSTIDHQDFAGYVVTALEQIKQRRHHVRRTSQAAKRGPGNAPPPRVGAA